MQKVTHGASLALTDDKILPIAERNEPALAGKHTHFKDLVYIDQGVAVNTTE